MNESGTMKRNSQIILIVLFFFLVAYGLITFQWGMVFSLACFIVILILVLVIFQKIREHLWTAGELNRKMALDIESLKESLDTMKDEIAEIKDLVREKSR